MSRLTSPNRPAYVLYCGKKDEGVVVRSKCGWSDRFHFDQSLPELCPNCNSPRLAKTILKNPQPYNPTLNEKPYSVMPMVQLKDM